MQKTNKHKTKEWQIDYKSLNIEKKYKESWLYFFNFYKENSKKTLIIALTAFFASAITIALPFLTQIITTSRTDKNIAVFITMAFIIIAIDIIKIILDFITEYLGQYFNYKLEVKWREDLIEKTHKLPITFFDNRSIGIFISRIIMDLKDITTFAFQFISNFVFVLITSIGGFIYIFYVSWNIGLVVGGIYLISILIYFLFIKKIVIIKQYIKVLNGQIIQDVNEQVFLMKEIKSYNVSSYEKDNFKNIQNGYLKETKKIYFHFALYKAIGIATNTLITSVILIVSSYWMIEGQLNNSQVLGLVAAGNLFVIPLINLAKLFVDSASVTAALTRLYDWMIQKEESNEGKLIHNFKGEIEFKNVCFEYKLLNDEKINVFDNLNFKVEKNSFINLYGAAAKGKTTLLSLLLRFYEIDSGEILFDGVNINQIDLYHLRKSISYKDASGKLFSSVVKEESIFKNDRAWEQILNELNLKDIYKKKLRVNQTVNSQGIQLSSSEIELLALAQALYNDNKIILIDNIDAFLTYEQIELVKNVLHKHKNNKTIIVVTKKENIFDADINLDFNNLIN